MKPAIFRALAACLASALGCASSEQAHEPKPSAGPFLVDVSEARGIDFTHEVGPERTYFLPELMGAGTALFDYDGDGDLDAYFVNAGPPPGVVWNGEMPPNHLYRQEADGRFVDATLGSGLESRGYGQGVAVGDYDNDGDVDVFVTNYGRNRLFRNEGAGRFSEATEEAGVGDRSWSSSATFCDYDADGWLDLYVATYVLFEDKECTYPTGRRDFCGPQAFVGSPDSLYRNNGDGTFADVTDSSGVGAAATKGLGVACLDLTGDGRFDFFVANDQEPNELWVQDADGTFEEEAVLRGVAFDEAGASEASMGIVVADLNGDERFDLYVTHLRGQGNTLYVADDGVFRDATAELGLHAPTLRFTGFGAVAVDFEHDGDQDLAVVNAHVYRGQPEPGAERGPFWNDYAQPGLILVNDGQGRFVAAGDETGSFTRVPEVGRSLAMGDVDGDGDVDLLVGNVASRARLFLNESPKLGHWLSVAARDPELRRDVYGAIVHVVSGDRRWVRRIDPATSYLSSSDPRAHFGLGAVERVDRLEVVWPGGSRERFPAPDLDRAIVLSRGLGEKVEG